MEKIKAAITIDSLISRSSKSSTSTASSSVLVPASGLHAVPTPAPAAAPHVVPDLRIRTVPPADYKAAAATLAEAFSADDVAAYFLDCPDTAGWAPARKWALHVAILEHITHAHCCSGLVRAIGDPRARGAAGAYDAVALWMPPGASMDHWATMLRTGAWRSYLRVRAAISREGRERLLREFFPLLHVTKEEVLKERDPESWYLVYLGTHSRARGKGLAKRLVGEVTRKADAESRACYLESSNAVNVPLYQKLGFETCKTIDLLRGKEKVSLDIMVREPVSG